MVTDVGGHASSAPNSPRAAPAGLHDVDHSIVSAIFSAAIRIGKLPVFSDKQTFSISLGKSQMCHQRTSGSIFGGTPK
jgi:hypothetical protein